jgi:hypothetical protein
MDGEIAPLNGKFKGGKDVPLHPNCLTGDAVVTAFGVSAHFKRWFVGEVVTIGIGANRDLTVTRNHPILTDGGWVAAGLLQVGDKIAYVSDPAAFSATVDPQNDYIESRVKEIFDSVLVSASVSFARVPTAAENFHGDGVIDGEVSIVFSNSSLSNDVPESADGKIDEPFCFGHGGDSVLNGDSSFDEFVNGNLSAFGSVVGGFGESRPTLCASVSHSNEHGFAAASDVEAVLDKVPSDGEAVATDGLGYINARLASHISFVEVKNLVFSDFGGHVYNLETNEGWYFANGIVTHNCRCDVLPIIND